MNVGQIFMLTWISGRFTKETLSNNTPFDERCEQKALRKLVFSELYEISKKKSTATLNFKLNPNTLEKAEYLIEEQEILLNNLF